MKNYHEIAALITTFLTIMAFIPQVFKTIKSKNAKTLSATSFLISYLGSLILTIFASIHDPFVWTTLIVDLTIMWLMLPILFYIFMEKNKKYFHLYFLIILLINVATTIIFILTRINIIPHGISQHTEFVLAIFGFSCTGFAFFPQTLIIIKNKNIGDFSFLLSIIYCLSQTLNVIFWSGRITIEKTNFEDWLPGITFASISAFIQLSTIILILIFKSKFKSV